MRKWMWALLFAGMPFGSAAFSQDGCDPNDMSQQAMNACAAIEYDAADATLNKLYTEMMQIDGEMSRIDGANQKATVVLLRKSQRAWLVFRDAECDYAASESVGGSMYPLLVSQCLTRLTEARIAQLKADANCEGGGECDEGK